MICLFQEKAIHGHGKTPSTVSTMQQGTVAASERHDDTVDVRDNPQRENLFEKVSEKAVWNLEASLPQYDYRCINQGGRKP